MRPITAWLLGSVGVFWLAAPPPGNAAVFRQNFEITVDRFTPPDLTIPTFFDPRLPEAIKLLPALNALPVPPIGTKGFGSYTYDESQLKLSREFSASQDTYVLGELGGKIAFSDFSINFFDHIYTQRTFVPSRIGEFLTYTRTSTGQFVPQSLNIRTFDDTSVVSVLGSGTGSDNFFTYRPGPVDFLLPSNVNSVSGIFRFTNAEPVPEPSFATIPALALGLGWLFCRKWTAQKNSGVAK